MKSFHNHIFLCLLLLVACPCLQAQTSVQQTIATGGGTAKVQELVIDFTIGETMITTIGNDPLCTQGIQQPLPKKDIPPADPRLHVSIYPNPVKSKLHLRLYAEQQTNVTVTIAAATGQLISANTLTLPKGYSDHTLSLIHCRPGMYVLTAREPVNGKRMVVKLIKE